MTLTWWWIFVLASLQCSVSGDDEDEEAFYDVNPEVGAYPFVLIIASKLGMCTGTLINKDWAMTAAHCLWMDKKKRLIEGEAVDVKAAALVMDEAELSTQDRKGLEIHAHPHFWYGKPGKFDVALIKVKSSFVLNNDVKTINISGLGWPQNEEKHTAKEYTQCFSVGYGSYRKTYSEGNHLKGSRNLTALHGERACPCAKRFQFKRMVCVHNEKDKPGYPDHPTHSMLCAGDDGGPLICNTRIENKTRVWEVVAIAHMVWNKNTCGDATYPKDKCVDNPDPGIDMFFYLCPVLGWMHKLVPDIPPRPLSCEASSSWSSGALSVIAGILGRYLF